MQQHPLPMICPDTCFYAVCLFVQGVSSAQSCTTRVQVRGNVGTLNGTPAELERIPASCISSSEGSSQRKVQPMPTTLQLAAASSLGGVAGRLAARSGEAALPGAPMLLPSARLPGAIAFTWPTSGHLQMDGH